MSVRDILQAENELTHMLGAQQPVVLSTRIRLARNLSGLPFPGWSKPAQREEVAERCLRSLVALPRFRRGHVLRMAELADLDRTVLVERHLVSKELAAGKAGAAVISRDQTCSVMVNEEDHLRIQVVKAGWHLASAWQIAEQLDDALAPRLGFAFSERLGYLTACPTNVGTGLRASAMLHLPGLCLSGHMDKVARGLGQDGLAVRGWLGEGTEAVGNVFQISNQQTLGRSEEEIRRHLAGWIKHVVEQEWNARRRLAADEGEKFVDRAARALGLLRHARLLTSAESMNMLSLLRLACDMGCLPEERRSTVDRLMIEGQPAHVQALVGAELDSDARDVRRAAAVREALRDFPEAGPPTA
ncbi:MAG: ATP--guanido phosphotransferase [Opitutales bacterium]